MTTERRGPPGILDELFCVGRQALDIEGVDLSMVHSFVTILEKRWLHQSSVGPAFPCFFMMIAHVSIFLSIFFFTRLARASMTL